MSPHKHAEPSKNYKYPSSLAHSPPNTSAVGNDLAQARSPLYLLEESFLIQLSNQARIREVSRFLALELRDRGAHILNRGFQGLSDGIRFIRVKSDRVVGVGRLKETRFDLELFLHHSEGDLFVGFSQPDSLGDSF